MHVIVFRRPSVGGIVGGSGPAIVGWSSGSIMGRGSFVIVTRHTPPLLWSPCSGWWWLPHLVQFPSFPGFEGLLSRAEVCHGLREEFLVEFHRLLVFGGVANFLHGGFYLVFFQFEFGRCGLVVFQ